MKMPELEMFLFGMTMAEALSKGICIQCKEPAIPKCYSEMGVKEYSISALCERCFDENTTSLAQEVAYQAQRGEEQ